jgi:RND family efflux transporter MFP subunit
MQESTVEKPRRRMLIWLAGIVTVVVVAAGVVFVTRNADGRGNTAGKKKDPRESTPASPVEISTVSTGEISTFLENTTTLEARSSAALVANRQGRVVELLAEEGQWVQKGAVLARLEDTEARLAVDRAEVTAQTSKREADRGQQMSQQGFLSDKEMDDLALKRRSAEVELAQARYNLDQTRIVAPFSGRVTGRSVNLGETVTPGRECFRLEDFTPILARVYFPERELPRVHVGQEAAVELDAQPGKKFPARVALVNPVVDRGNGTFKVTLELPNPGGDLRPGSFAHVSLRTGSFKSALLIPRRGVLTEDGEQYVFVARGDSAVRNPVRIGAVEGETAQVLAGLVAGSRVVTVGQGGLKSGSKIRVVHF